MPDAGVLPGFVLATIVLNLIPGPNVALIVANSVAYGTRYGLLTIAGTSPALMLQLALTTFGMTEAISVLGTGFGLLRWVGVAYLIYAGVQQWRAPAADLAAVAPRPRSAGIMWGRGFLVSLLNPKTLLFFSAFLPQFIVADRPAGPQLAVLSAVFAVVMVCGDSLWALAAGRARPFLIRRGRLANRLSGGAMVTAGMGLALARVE